MTEMERYNQALEWFLEQMSGVRQLSEEDMQTAIEPLCRVLRIARVEIRFYENPRDEAAGKLAGGEHYDNAAVDTARFLSYREVTGGGNVAYYGFFQIAGDADWDEEEQRRIGIFQKTYYAFHSRARLTELVERRTFYDEELGIPNLRYFLREVGGHIAHEDIASYGMCNFNLKHFSLVNERVGREGGTEVMRRYIAQLRELIAPSGVVCRMGGDNFVTLFPKGSLGAVREHLRGTGIVHNDESGDRIRVSAVAGYYMPMTTDILRGPGDVMDRIIPAMQAAKRSSETDEVFFDEALAQRQNSLKQIEAFFPGAIRDEEFKVYYQPKVGLNDYHLVGAEALCRWVHDGRLMPPAVFIPPLEQSMMICELDFYMLDHVCRDLRRWLDSGIEPVKVSVNLSRRHLGDMDLVEHILEIINRHEVPHQYIEIELTETTTDVEFKDLKALVGGLQEAGVSTSVDDFGVGYSSLNLIREIPWNVLKFDKCFLPVMSEGEDTNQSIMLRHLIAMAQDMGLECIVEGVETREHVRLLQKNKCFLAQGFYFDKPMPVEEFESRLKEKDSCYYLLGCEVV